MDLEEKELIEKGMNFDLPNLIKLIIYKEINAKFELNPLNKLEYLECEYFSHNYIGVNNLKNLKILVAKLIHHTTDCPF